MDYFRGFLKYVHYIEYQKNNPQCYGCLPNGQVFLVFIRHSAVSCQKPLPLASVAHFLSKDFFWLADAVEDKNNVCSVGGGEDSVTEQEEIVQILHLLPFEV